MSSLSSVPQLLAGNRAPVAAGSFVSQRGGKEGEAVASVLKGKYAESCASGLIFAGCTPAAGVAPGTALGTTCPLVLWNKGTNKVRAELIKFGYGYLSGTMGAGAVFHTINGAQGNTAISGGTAITPVCTDGGNTAVSQCVLNSGGTSANTPTALYPFLSMGPFLATTAFQFDQVIEDLDGIICLEPGAIWSPQMIGGAGTSPLVFIGVVWREVPNT